jgi:hypothetical protein
VKGKRKECDIIKQIIGKSSMARPAIQPIELDSADQTMALQMTRWLTHLKSERRLSPKRATSGNAWISSASTGARG